MKYVKVIQVENFELEWDEKSNACKQGLYTIKGKGFHKRDWQYSCTFSQAMEFLSANLLKEEPRDLPHKLELISEKIQELLRKMPAEWRSRWSPNYKLTTWH